MDINKLNLKPKKIPSIKIEGKEQPKFSFYCWYFKFLDNLSAKFNFSWHF